MKKVLFVAAIALCAMGCCKKAETNAEAQEEVVTEEVVAEEAAAEEVPAEEVVVEEAAAEVAE